MKYFGVAEENNIDIQGTEIIEPDKSELFDKYAEELYLLRQRRGLTRTEAVKLIGKRNYFGAMMVHRGDADGLISGLTTHYPATIRPALQVIGMDERFTRVAGLYIIIPKRGEPLFFADTTVNINPNSEQLAEIALMAADAARRFNVEPRVALLSFSNFGSAREPESNKVRAAVEILTGEPPNWKPMAKCRRIQRSYRKCCKNSIRLPT